MTKVILLRACCTVAFLMPLIVVTPHAQTRKIKKEMQTEFVVDGSGRLVPDTTELTKLYNKKGLVIEEAEKSIWPQLQRVVVYAKKHFHNARGRNDSTRTFIDGKLTLTLKLKYDSSGREIGVQEIADDGKPGYRVRNFYTGNNKQKSRQEMYDPDGKPFSFRNYSYDAKGNLVDESGTEGGQPRYRWLSRYDDKNRLVERLDYSGLGELLEKHVYKYGVNGKISRENVINAQGKLVRVMKYRYDYY